SRLRPRSWARAGRGRERRRPRCGRASTRDAQGLVELAEVGADDVGPLAGRIEDDHVGQGLDPGAQLLCEGSVEVHDVQFPHGHVLAGGDDLPQARFTAAVTSASDTVSSRRTVISTFCLSKSTFLTPLTFFSSARTLSAQLSQSAPCSE